VNPAFFYGSNDTIKLAKAIVNEMKPLNVQVLPLGSALNSRDALKGQAGLHKKDSENLNF